MRRFPVLLSLGLALFALSGGLAGCSLGGGKARCVLSFAPGSAGSARIADGAGRAIVPEGIAVATVRLAGKGPAGAKAEAASSGTSPLELELIPGEWDFTAKGLSSTGAEVAEGELRLCLAPGSLVSGSITLLPLSGSGSASLTWSLEGSVGGSLRVKGGLTGSSGARREIDADFAASPLDLGGLEAGSWKLELGLYADGAKVCGLAEAILVAAGMKTAAAVSFRPPEARLALSFLKPDYENSSFALNPGARRAAPGTRLGFRAPEGSHPAWFLEGSSVASLEAPEGCPARPGELWVEPPASPWKQRVDCLILGEGPVPRSGSAAVRLTAARGIGALAWAESIFKEDFAAGTAACPAGLGDCRDLAWSADGKLLAAAGKSSGSLSVFEAAKAGATYAVASLGAGGGDFLAGPTSCRFHPSGAVLVLSEGEASLASVQLDTDSLKMSGKLTDQKLAGGKDFVISKEGDAAYVAAASQDSVVLVRLGAKGEPLSAAAAAGKDSGNLASFSKPACIALSADGSLLAVGTTGDDAIYLFNRDAASGSLAFRERIDKAAFPAATPLSDPVSLAFAADGLSFYTLSYYGKSVLRLDRADGNSAFAFSSGAKSGSGGVAGFSSPKELCLAADGKSLVVAGGGAEDGLALFEAGSPGCLAYVGTILSSGDDCLSTRLQAAAFSPGGKLLAAASDGKLALFERNP